MASPPHQEDFSPAELFVSQILLEFPDLIQKSQFSLGLPPAWPLHRKRSAVQSPPGSFSSDAAAAASSVPPPSKKVKLSIPVTTLVLDSKPLSRCVSDENPNAKRSCSSKKPPVDKKSQYVEAIDNLTKQNQGLEGEIEAYKQHFNHLKTINCELKAIKHQIIKGSTSKSSKIKFDIPEIGTSKSAMKFAKFSGESSNHRELQRALTAEQSIMNSQFLQFLSGAIPFYDPSLVGPTGLPDLNIAYDEFTQKTYSRFLAALARQNRIQICKSKNNGSAKL